MAILATLCYVRRSGHTLMLLRNKNCDDIHRGKWNGLGGKLEPGESPEMCVRREVKEEAGIDIDSPKLRGILTFPAFDGRNDWVVFVFTATIFSGTLIDSPEGRLAWIKDEELLKLPLWEGDRIFIPWLSKSSFFSGIFHYENASLTRHDVVFYSCDPESADAATGNTDAGAAGATAAPTDKERRHGVQS